MATRELIFRTFLFAASVNLVLTMEDKNVEYQSEKEVRVVGRAYSLTGCSYEEQAGFTCLSCHRALHCYIGGAAVMVDCYGLFRYCRDGRCSRKQGDKCSGDELNTPASRERRVMSLKVASEVPSAPLNVAFEKFAPAAISTANDVN